MRAAGQQPGLGRGGEVRTRGPDRACYGQVRQRLVRGDGVHLVGHQPEAVAQVGQADHERRAGSGVEDQPDRVLAAADAERVDLAGRPGRRDGRADLQHVRAEGLRRARTEVVGVVLHEGGAAGQPVGHRLDRAQQDRGLPVALAAEAVAVGHQPLHGDAGQLAQAAEVLEVGGEGAEAAVGEEGPQAGLDPGRLAQRVVPVAAATQLRDHVVGLLVLGRQLGDPLVLHGVDHRDQVVDAPGVHRDAEADLGLHLVALGHRDVAHVVAEAGDLEVLDGVPADRRAGPGADLDPDGRVAGVAEDHLAVHPHPGLHGGELPVAVRGLVEVHEVHVDGRPRQRRAGLRVQVQERLAQGLQPADPHLGRGERVHPGDDTRARVVGAGVQAGAPDGVGLLEDRLGDDPDRHVLRAGQQPDHLGGLLGDLPERLLAVEVLAPGEEPDLEVLLPCCAHVDSRARGGCSPPSHRVLGGGENLPAGLRGPCATGAQPVSGPGTPRKR